MLNHVILEKSTDEQLGSHLMDFDETRRKLLGKREPITRNSGIEKFREYVFFSINKFVFFILASVAIWYTTAA